MMVVKGKGRVCQKVSENLYHNDVSCRAGLTNVCFLKSINGPAQFKDNSGVVASLACCRAGEDSSSAICLL